MKSELRRRAIELRTRQEMSYSMIRKKLGVPKSTLSYWLRDFPLDDEKILELRRAGWKKGESSRERYRNTMRKKKEDLEELVYKDAAKQFKNLSKESLYLAGLLMYEAEGDKKSRYRISLANTDINLIKFFIKWLKMFFNVQQEELRLQLHLYESMNIKKEEEYWCAGTGLTRGQLYKTQVRKLTKNSFTYSSTNGHGTCQVSYSNRDKKMRIIQSVKAFFHLHI